MWLASELLKRRGRRSDPAGGGCEEARGQEVCQEERENALNPELHGSMGILC